MPDLMSSLRPVDHAPAGTARLIRFIALVSCGVVGVLWAAALLLRLFETGPQDSVTACRNMIYRDPLTGREQGIGTARIAPDSAITCHGVTYRAGSQ